MATDNKDNKLSIGSGDYAGILRHAVAVIEHARTEIARHVNGYVSTAYWEIGQMLHERKIESGYGDRVAKRLSADLKERYPKMGVSPRNLWDMKKFYERFCHSDIKVRQAVALLPGDIYCNFFGKLVMIMQQCFPMQRRHALKVGIATCCSMPLISKCMRHRYWHE